MDTYKLYVNDFQHTAGLRGTAIFQCPFTKDCENNLCFWKQRDCYGLCPWALFDQKLIDEQNSITEKYGESYFPEWKIQPGTNCIMVYCTGTTINGEKPNKNE